MLGDATQPNLLLRHFTGGRETAQRADYVTLGTRYRQV